MYRRLVSTALVVAFIVTISAIAPSRALATPVATDDATYALYGRVFPDPHGCVRGQPGKSPFAKGNVCASQFIQFPELIRGLRFLDSKFPEFLEIYELPVQSAGLPTNTLERRRFPLYAVRVTDERVAGAKRKFAFSLSIHGIERAGAEGGTRAIEDLVTWGRHEPSRGLVAETLPDSAVSVGDALARSEMWFFYPNPDGWNRGDVSQGGLVYQRYNGNGVDLNRDWPTKGYTFTPYTPGSEPESQAFAKFLKDRGGPWAGTSDLHGMLDAIAFTFTMLPAGQFDYARNGAIVDTVRRIRDDAFPRLRWFPLIRPYDQTPSTTRPWAQQWGTVWDTINYTTTGSLGDWMGNPLGLDAYVGIDNEMWLSHLAPNNAFDPDLEQAHVDGNKGLIYAQIESTFRPATTAQFPAPGRLAYVDHGRVFQSAGGKAAKGSSPKRQPQADLSADLTAPRTDGSDPTFEFTVLGKKQNVNNGGFTVQVTWSNVQAISPGATAAVFVERFGDAHGAKEWEVVNQDFNQDSVYLQAGMTVNVNEPQPGLYRVRLQGAPPGVHRVGIDFTSGPSWVDPGQAAYRASSIDFFRDLDRYLPADRKTARVTPQDILGGADLSAYDTLVLVNDPFPGFYDPQPTGAAQADESFEILLGPAVPAEGSETVHEFTMLPGFNTNGMRVSVTWTIPSDYDLFLERQTPSGDWAPIGSALNFVNTGETIETAGVFPGRYRVRIVNFAAVAQPLHGSIDYLESSISPVAYAVTRSADERDAYYARLRAFVEGGGNLVLTDGAARALPHLGYGTPGDVKPTLVYAPFIGFTKTGADTTYDDPLAANVNQHGAAEGAGHRHQTVEPVPLGYAIQDENGGNKGHSFTWVVSPDIWPGEAQGGRIVGTVGAAVAFGEIVRGQGRIRFVGGLLPDPEERYDHQFGLASYALTWSGWQILENVVQWRRP